MQKLTILIATIMLIGPSSASARAPSKPEFSAVLARERNQWSVVAYVPCKRGGCRGKTTVLGNFDNVRFHGMIDLLGPEKQLRHQHGKSGWPHTLPRTAKMPAAVYQMSSSAKGSSRTYLAIVAVSGAKPGLLFKTQLSSRAKGGGGFSTINTIRFTKREKQKPLVVEFSQTSIPAPGARPFRPGPPLRMTYKYNGKKYAR